MSVLVNTIIRHISFHQECLDKTLTKPRLYAILKVPKENCNATLYTTNVCVTKYFMKYHIRFDHGYSSSLQFIRDEYAQKLHGEMSDSATYEEVPGDRTRTVQNKVKKVVDTLYKKGSIDNDLRRYMTGYEGTSGKLQGNPKLHKPGMPLRTIVNGRNHPTEKMAEIVEDELREHVKSLPSYIRDTTDILHSFKLHLSRHSEF